MGNPLELFKKYGFFPGADVQVTHSNPNQARSECALAIDPSNPLRMVATSKKFIDPKKYRFTVGVSWSDDGGASWTEASLPKLPSWNNQSWDGMTDPAVIFAPNGDAHLLTEPIVFGTDDIHVTGFIVFNSRDGGKTWESPVDITAGRAFDETLDDKGWIAVDSSGGPHHGQLYVAFGVGRLSFARSSDGGRTWKGLGNQPAGERLNAYDGWAPEITVGVDGVVHIVWHFRGSSAIRYCRSLDGGATMSPATDAATGITDLDQGVPSGEWPKFPNATFRVITLATGCALLDGRFVVGWSDKRDGEARIFYRASTPGGAQWTGPANGQPLMPWFPMGNGLYHFHPQLLGTPSGAIGCAFYEFGPKLGGHLIDTRVAGCFDLAQGFSYISTVTDQPWEPAIDAPLAHADSDTTFIGEYFGFDAVQDRFGVLWTDTRTKVQELFFDTVETERTDIPEIFKGISAEILAGVMGDGGGWILVGGKVVKVPPRGPIWQAAQALVAFDSAEKIKGPAGAAIRQGVGQALMTIAGSMSKGKQR